jgi:hypothetical protein
VGTMKSILKCGGNGGGERITHGFVAYTKCKNVHIFKSIFRIDFNTNKYICMKFMCGENMRKCCYGCETILRNYIYVEIDQKIY